MKQENPNQEKAVLSSQDLTNRQVKSKALIGITSPPYEEAEDRLKYKFQEGRVSVMMSGAYDKKHHGNSEGQIGSMKSQPTQELDFDITKYHKCGGEIYWRGCYGSENYYKQFVTPESYAHPAKISFLLTERIFKHLEHLGLLKEGMTVCDIMAGSGRIPLIASLKGYDSVGVELELHFIKMCEDNKKCAENKIGRKLNFEIIQGDSRQLSKILNKGDKENQKDFLSSKSKTFETVGITSPPYKDSLEGGKPKYILELAIKKKGLGSVFSDKNNINNPYSPSNIGNLPYVEKDKLFRTSNIVGSKEMVGVVSPPYQDSLGEGKSGINWDKAEENHSRIYTNKSLTFQKNYSQNPQNIGNLPDKNFNIVSDEQYQIIIGTLLGDGYLGQGGSKHPRKSPRTYYLQISHSNKQKEYIFWLWEKLKDFCNQEPKLVINGKEKKYTSYMISTRKHPLFSDLHSLFYKDGKKYINPQILDMLTPLSIAIWFMDDCSTYKEKNLEIAVCCFTDEEREMIIKYFKDKFDLECFSKEKGKNYKVLIFLKKDAYKLTQILKPYIIPSMRYKFCFDNFYYKTPIVKDKELVGITSPPYEEGLGHISNNEKDFGILRLGSKAYGETDGQIGRLKEQGQPSYLSAMIQVYQEAYKSGMQVICTITKNPTRAGKLRRLDIDTAVLLEKSGFKIVDYHRAVLFKTIEQSTLTGETKKEHKGRLSFFKRLSLSKGNQASMWEDILIGVRK